MPNSGTVHTSPEKEQAAHEIRVERRFSCERQSREMLRRLICAHENPI